MAGIIFLLVIIIVLCTFGTCLAGDYASSIVFFVAVLCICAIMLVVIPSAEINKEQNLCYKAVTTCASNGLQGEVTDLEDYKEWLKEYAGDVVMNGGVAPDVTMILANVKEVRDE